MNTILFGTLLKKLRKQANMNQEQLADRLSVSVSAVSKWETSKNLPDIEKITELSNIFGISIEDLCHPEQTIAKLENNEIFSTDNPTSQSGKLKFWIILTISCIFIVSVIAILLLWNDKEKQPSARPYTSRMIEEELFGSVYELAIIYSGDLDILSDPTSDYMEQIYFEWCDNTNVPSEVTTMKISFYETEETASQWNPPNKSTYFFR